MSGRDIPYSALPSQKRFHDSTARFKAFSGPVGSGKSQALCQEAIRLSFMNPGCMGLIGAPTRSMLMDATLTQFLKICHEAHLPHQWLSAQARLRFQDNGSVVVFRSLDRFEHLRGPNLAWFGVDELTYAGRDAWERLEARLRDPAAKCLCGFAAFTPKGFDWVHEKFRGNPIEGYELIEAAPFENKHVLAQTPDYYQRLRRSYDGYFYEQEALGKFLNVRRDRVYHDFGRAVHVRTLEYNPNLSLRWTWDFNVHAMSSLICQQQGEEVRVLDEIVLPTSSTPEVCREFAHRWGHHCGQFFVYGDASGASLHSAAGKSDYHIIRCFFKERLRRALEMCVPRANPPVRDRVNAVNGKLKNAEGECRLFIDPKCRELIKDLEQVSYKPDSSMIDKESDPARTHTSDALGYYVWHEFRPIPPIGEKLHRLL